ncbi:MAG: ribose 5-phosphate isomerase B [Firmicutes bacterium]|jgi:ribose 5-phosphate isomerase B|nr:ribose 5-phosphate isomerase B [Bacillota bacterium]
MKIALGSDHAGFKLKNLLVEKLQHDGHEVLDLGTYSLDPVDYPDFGEAVGKAVAAGEADFGVACCGTGIGISIAANKVKGVRAAVVHDVTSAMLAREHNNANVICLGARLLGESVAIDALDAFMAADFEGGRHEQRIAKLTALDEA